jgi:hypothetical protein
MFGVIAQIEWLLSKLYLLHFLPFFVYTEYVFGLITHAYFIILVFGLLNKNVNK